MVAGGGEGYLQCAAVAVWITSTRNPFSLGVLHRGDANRIVMAAWSVHGAAKRIVMGLERKPEHESVSFSVQRGCRRR